MVQTTYPGVYVVEKPSGVRTITGVATSIGAFLGRASRGPINRAVRVLSYGDYARTFGDPHPQSDLADSVRLFFSNGGTDAYVIRLAKDAVKASVTLKDLNDQNVLVATAKAAGTHGNTIRLEVDYNTANPGETFNLRVRVEALDQPAVVETHTQLSMDPTSARFAPTFVTASSAAIDLALAAAIGPASDPAATIYQRAASFVGFSQSRRALGNPPAVRTTLKDLIKNGSPHGRFRFEVSVNGSDWARVSLASLTDVFIDSASLKKIEEEIEDAVNDALKQVDPTLSVKEVTLAGTANRLLLEARFAGADRSSVHVRMGASNDIAGPLMLGVEQGGVESARWSNFRPAPTATHFSLGSVAADASIVERTDGLTKVERLRQTDLTSITIDGEQIELDTGDFDLETVPGGGSTWAQDGRPTGAANGNRDGVREKLRIMKRAINANANLKYRAELWGYHLALVPTEGGINTRPATIAADGPKSANFQLTGPSSRWEPNVRRYSLGTASTEGGGFFVTGKVAGEDGSAPGATEYLGNEASQTGLHALDPVDLFNLLVLPGDQDVSQLTLDQVLGPAGIYCRSRRAFLLIDAPKGSDAWTNPSTGRPEVVQDTGLVGNLRNLLGAATDHAAVFYPNLQIPIGPALRSIGPSGAIAGLMARTDASRGVWKAPAGTDARINAINGLEVVLTDAENGVLNPVAVNCLRVMPAGFVNWGARTLAGTDADGSEWKYVPVRRLALFIEESLYRGTHWVVFEPNDEPLWSKIRLNVGAFMTRLFRQGAFQGSSPDEAFFVKCDAETTPQADRDLGIVNIVIGFAPLKPAEFVVITIQQIGGDL